MAFKALAHRLRSEESSPEELAFEGSLWEAMEDSAHSCEAPVLVI